MGYIGNSSISINNVWLLDKIKHNLLGISKFCDSGYEVMFNKNNCIVMNESDKNHSVQRYEDAMFIKLNFLNWFIRSYYSFY